MNPVLAQLHATARHNEFLAHASQHRLARHARLQRRSRVTNAGILKALGTRVGVGRKGRFAAAPAT